MLRFLLLPLHPETKKTDMNTKEINVTEILSLPTYKFRSTNDETASAFIHNSQIECAKEVVASLLRKETRRNSVVLSAKMQSGKTGVTTAITNIISTTPLYREMAVDKFFFITGMNDSGLKDQTSNRIINQVIMANVDNTYIGKRSKKNLSKNRFYVLKNSDLMKFEETTLNNSVIFIDEAHYGSNEKNILTKFMAKHHINWKNTNDLITRNIYLVSVSATPFDEIFSDKAECKKIIELKPGQGYVGVSEMLSNGMVMDADKDDITENGVIFEYIDDAYSRMQENGEIGAIIIRTKKFDIIKDDPSVQQRFDFFEMTSSSSRVDYKGLNAKFAALNLSNKMNAIASKTDSVTDVPTILNKPLLVLIKGAFRAGITLDSRFKDIIYMVYDYSIKSETTAQALLGRMCGYRDSNDQVLNTKIYINKSYAEMYGKWENDMQNRTLLPANKMKYDWIDNDYSGNDARLRTKSKGNFTVQLDGDECKAFLSCAAIKKDKTNKVEQLIAQIFAKNGIDITYDYIGEMYLNGKNNYAVSTQKKRFDDFTKDSTVCQFIPKRLHGFKEDTGRDVATPEDLGKSAIDIMLDCTVEYINGVQCISGMRRLLVYNYELGQQIMMPNRKDMYKKHKDTSLI